MLAFSALISRIRDRGIERPYRMPLWPLPPIVALIGCVIIVRYQQALTLVEVGIVLMLGAAYYRLYLKRHPAKWVLRDPVGEDESPAEAAAEQAS